MFQGNHTTVTGLKWAEKEEHPQYNPHNIRALWEAVAEHELMISQL